MGSIRLVHLLILSTILTIGCAASSGRLPNTIGDYKSVPSYGYTPIDPLPVIIWHRSSKDPVTDLTNNELLELFPDETMRIAIGQIQIDGSITYGLAKTGIAGNNYVVILDYVKFDTTYIMLDNTYIIDNKTEVQTERPKTVTRIPVYTGVGLRLTANVKVNEGSIDLGNLIALGVASQSKQVSGTMVIQTLGISGENISAIIPMPSEINPTSIQNAILSLGSIKAKMYSPGTMINARVVGVYNNLGGGQDTINRVISSILSNDGVAIWVKKYNRTISK